jgi:threonine dehydrogenase-like Zn-dependent dehydrogenase
MRGAVLHAPGDVRLDTRDDPRIEHQTDAIIRLAATWCAARTCGPTAASKTVDGPAPMGHEYAGIVEEAGTAVTTLKPGQFVVGSFFASDNTCEICQAGYQSRCVHAELMGAIGTQAEYARIPLADGTLVATPAMPDEKFVPSLLAASDVLGTG